MTNDDLAEALRGVGEAHYHDKHPFHRAMNGGELTRTQLQTWVANRYYFETRLPIADALIVAKSEAPAFRRRWLRRIVDRDGARPGDGSLAQWLVLAEGVGLDSTRVAMCTDVLATVRFACDRYVAFVREMPVVAAVASTLTDLFAPDLLAARIAAWERHYRWVDPDALACFRVRVTRARRDGEEAFAFVCANAVNAEARAACLAAFRFKCEVLWDLLDGVEAYPEWVRA